MESRSQWCYTDAPFFLKVLVIQRERLFWEKQTFMRVSTLPNRAISPAFQSLHSAHNSTLSQDTLPNRDRDHHLAVFASVPQLAAHIREAPAVSQHRHWPFDPLKHSSVTKVVHSHHLAIRGQSSQNPCACQRQR